jgi:hypothetical protein
MQHTTIWTNQVIDDHNTKADNAKSVAIDTTTFLKANTICSLKALKEEDQLQLIDKLFALEQ